MDCWSCGAPAGGEICGCGAPQPLPPGANAFQVLGLPRTFFLDRASVEARFKDLNRRFHPDRWVRKGARERRFALTWATAVNDASRSLLDPVGRAAYLLKLEGLDLERESGPGAMRLPVELLERFLEQREALAEARAAGDAEAVRALGEAQRALAERALADLEVAMRAFEATGERAALARAAARLAALKYHGRFLGEVRLFELDALERG